MLTYTSVEQGHRRVTFEAPPEPVIYAQSAY